MFIIDVPAGHQDIFTLLRQEGAVAGVGDPDKFSVHYGKMVPVGVLDLDIVASLLTNIALFKDSGTKNYEGGKTRIKRDHGGE